MLLWMPFYEYSDETANQNTQHWQQQNFQSKAYFGADYLLGKLNICGNTELPFNSFEINCGSGSEALGGSMEHCGPESLVHRSSITARATDMPVKGNTEGIIQCANLYNLGTVIYRIAN